MKRLIPETLSITEVIRYVFPYMSAATIHLWMAKGIFVPEVYVPRPSGRSRGCELSLSDMVAVGILHSLFTLGATSHEVQISSQNKSEQIRFLGSGFTELQRDEFVAEGRLIQRYLEKMDYHCHVLYQPLHVKTYLGEQRNSKGRILAKLVFFPSTKDFEHYMNVFRLTWNVSSDVIPEELHFRHTSHPVAHCYINVRDWLEVVREGLEAI